MSSKSLDHVLIKTAHKEEYYSEQHIKEFMECADPITGPAYFLSNFFYIQHPTRGKIQYQPFKYQLDLADTYHKYRFSINLLSRQLGKTTTAAGYLLWYAMFVPDSTILVAAHKFAGAQEIMQRIRYAYETMPNHIRAGAVNYNKGSLEFDNGSRIISTATTENTGRGLSISLLYCLGGETTVKIRHKETLVEEEISLKNLYIRLSSPKKILSDEFAFVDK